MRSSSHARKVAFWAHVNGKRSARSDETEEIGE
jgi:hypothetical protein